MDALHQARCGGLQVGPEAWAIQQALVDHLEGVWQEPDEGIWEVRGGRQQFTHSKVMAWVALDRTIRSAEQFGLPGPLRRWRRLRAHIHRDVCERGFNPDLGAFVQSYGSSALDASLLLMPLVGLPPGEGAFLACSFWLADNLLLQGRIGEARQLFERLLAARNDVGLLAEEYDAVGGRQLGNFPQAFSHLALVGTSLNFERTGARPIQQRASSQPEADG